MYDYLIVGAGLFGATFAHLARLSGRKCLVIDRRRHVAGNCHTEPVGDIQVHQYGPHIFHTSDDRVWAFVTRFATFNHFTYRPRVRYKEQIYSFPINLMTLHQLWGVRTPAEAEARLQQHRVPCAHPKNLEEYVLSQVGVEIYETFIRGYTTKQWGRDPKHLPASIIRRLPIRLTYDDNYFHDRYQGVPIEGYTHMVNTMLDGTEVVLGCDYFAESKPLLRCARRVVYTGSVDQYFGYRFGRLEYRSLRFQVEKLSGDFQGVAVVNYTDRSIPYTRIVEHKHFTFGTQPYTVITREYPAPYTGDNEPFYPVNDATNNALYRRYRALAESSGVLFGGRLGSYRYYDMHQVIAQAMAMADKELT
jgi:UDP-galactopyranose mutase